MAKLVYSMSVSLDGFVNGPDGGLDAFDVDEEIHAWFNDRAREADAFLYGRRLYETMTAYWPTAEADPAATPVMLDFARSWVPKPKIVFSSTLASVGWNGRLVRGDPTEALAELGREFDGELDVGGPTVAAAFIRRGLVDEYRLVVHPVLLGGGTPFFPALDRPLHLRSVATRRFGNGAVLLTYVPA